MSWLTPLGFLGLTGLAVLILIYIIKPNYPNKRISSTFIWRLSLKYKKQTIPISKIQNVITFLCQMLILTILGLLLARPVITDAASEDDGEVVLIVDASAGMRISDSGESRFNRAVAEAKKMAEETFGSDSPVSLIVADDDPEFIFRRQSAKEKESALVKIDELYNEGKERCGWSAADMSGAISLAESVIQYNPKAKVYLYTGTSYTYHNGVNVVNVGSEKEWNATILDAKAELNSDNHYEITVNAACYGKTDFITVHCDIHGVNGDDTKKIPLERGEFFDPSEEEKTLVFTGEDFGEEAIYSYDYVEVYVSVKDSLAEDNSFFLYGGKKPLIKVQYASSCPNNFFESSIRSLRQNKREAFDLQFTFLKENEAPELKGFDLYIFEHRMPDEIPTDGVVLLVDPDSAPIGSGLQIGGSYLVDSQSTLSPGASHVITNYVDPGRITIAKYNDVVLAEGYEELISYKGKPVMLVKDTPESKVIVWAFDLNYSNLIALPDFSFLMYNTFNHFIPSTFDGNAFEIGDTVKLNGRGTELKVTENGEEYTFEGNKGEITLKNPGTYTVTQKEMDGETVIEENFFVKIPSSESDTTKNVEVLPSVESSSAPEFEYKDMLFYLAIALVCLMFAEWVLEIKKNY
ncbi:MAG: VWA domain-containing protein [Ruminococcaceae bacterium]|nr:VWA domain-containing protein [Oscillospiraceae bacterium]